MTHDRHAWPDRGDEPYFRVHRHEDQMAHAPAEINAGGRTGSGVDTEVPDAAEGATGRKWQILIGLGIAGLGILLATAAITTWAVLGGLR